ncbi:hypothetical protein PI125_g5562 [Phytophthora idaei]|nr:hypothetical protein PI125_g5562 [Phytophthora idaei]
MSTAAHPETDGQTERVNHVLEDIHRSYTTSFPSWSSLLPLAEFALNNAVHASTGLSTFFVNICATRVFLSSSSCVSTLGGEEAECKASVSTPTPTSPATTPVLSQPVSILIVNHFSSAASTYASVNAVTCAQARKTLTTPRNAAAPLVSWADQNLINHGATSRVSTPANYAPKQAARPVDTAAASAFVLQRQAVARYGRDALRSAAARVCSRRALLGRLR